MSSLDLFADIPVEPAVRWSLCPGCGSPTLTERNAETIRVSAWWCKECLRTKVSAARAGSCACSDLTHEHAEGAVA